LKVICANKKLQERILWLNILKMCIILKVRGYCLVIYVHSKLFKGKL
jgi:hypothetical protein